MKLFLSLFLILLFSSTLLSAGENVDECLIETGHRVYHFGPGQQNVPQLFLKSSCSAEINASFQKTLTNSNGPISSQHLQSLINEDRGSRVNIQITPERLRVYNLSELVRERTQVKDNEFFRRFSLMDKGPLILNEHEQLIIQCQNCRQLGEVNIELVINHVNDSKFTSRWLKAELIARTQALVAVSPQRVSHQSLKTEEFHLQTIETSKPADYFIDVEKIAFYRLNRPLAIGEPLKFSDLGGVNLVNVGTPAKVFLENANLSLSRMANPIRGGKFGEMIQLRNPQTNKTILGKVIDFNKVQVEL